MRNALFYVAKEEGSDKVLGTAMWMPPRSVGQKQSWGEWMWEGWEGWRLWANQVKMNLWYGRGGLNVKVWKPLHKYDKNTADLLSAITSGSRVKQRLSMSFGRILEDIIFLILLQFSLQSKEKE